MKRKNLRQFDRQCGVKKTRMQIIRKIQLAIKNGSQ